ncbi:MAG TPA: SRPBCC family protein [Solirubrobacterales bacterium]|jgi:uncharacterized protein YndB with AHSA1/START domain
MSDATLITDHALPAVRLERDLPDPPELVWAALTERERLREWFPCDVVVEGGEWRVGAAISFPFPPAVIEMTLSGEVLAVEEPRRLEFTWGEETLRFELSPREGGTRLVLVDELPAGSAARNAAGWDGCLDKLAGTDPAPDAWKQRFAAYSAAFEPELGSQEGPPAGYKGNEATAGA